MPPSAPRPNAPAAAGSGDRPLGVLIDTKPDPAPAPRAPRPIASPAMGVPTAPPPTPTAGARSERPLGSLIKPIFAAPAHPSGLAPAASPADPATAPAPGPTTAPSAGAPADQPVHLVADQLQFDRERKIITADGNVEVRYGARQLSADHITYNQNNNVVTAKGNVTLIEPSGEKIFGDTMDVSGDLKDALIHNIGIILQDRSRIAGVNAEHTAGRITNLRKAVYSPCNLCADDPTGPPMWRIKAVKVIHDKDAKVVEYRDAWLEVFGVPVAYTPYFRHPDPTVKGKSGFLFPKFGNSSDFGAVIETPYFWNISPHEDATITPIWMTKEFPVLRAEYRKRMLKGALDFDGSVTDNTADDEFDTEKGELGVRGHILGKGRFDVDQTWRWGFDLERATDDTYMRRYGFSSPASLNSQLFAEGFRRQNYFSVKALAFQGLAANDDQDEIPIALPLIDFNHFGRRDRLGGRTNLDLNLLALTRSEGTDVRRLSVHPSWERPFSTGLGDQYRLTVGLNADLYHVSNLERSGIDGRFTGLSQRAVPYAALDWRMPFIKLDNKISQTIEPVASVVWRPYGGNPDDIPNEDSTDLEFDETNLFDVNRFTGIDRVEGGPRINYGINWGVFGKEGGSTKFFLGQSYR
ncbi:MAG: LPS assembly protein LptD, partial [Magnetovibrio sp.]|nr:LPS assembly protein LptD [Magnetovibrio sp.]